MDDLFEFDDGSLAKAADAAKTAFLDSAHTAEALADALRAAVGTVAIVKGERDALASRFPMFPEEYDRLRAVVREIVESAVAQGIPVASLRSWIYRTMNAEHGVRRSVYLPHRAAQAVAQWIRGEAVDRYLESHSERLVFDLSSFVEWLVAHGLKRVTAQTYRSVVARVSRRVIADPGTLAGTPAKALLDLTSPERAAVAQYRRFLAAMARRQAA